MNKIYALLPCYNEEENIEDLIIEWNKQKEELEKLGYELEIIAINDASTDSTKEKILEMSKIYNNITLLNHEANKGLSGGLNTGVTFFINNGKLEDLAVLMDGDNTHNPIYIHEMIKKLREGNDCVIASRYCKTSDTKAEVVGVAKHREMMSDFAKYYYSIILRVPNVKDYTCGYRIYTYDIIKKLFERFGQEPIKEKSFACMMELLYKLYIVGAKFDEVGFILRYDNKKGASKMQVLRTARKSLSTAVKLKFGKKI